MASGPPNDQAAEPEIDTFNKCLVGTGRDGGINVMHFRGGYLSRDDALNMAAWIVAITDRERFEKVLEAVLEC